MRGEECQAREQRGVRMPLWNKQGRRAGGREEEPEYRRYRGDERPGRGRGGAPRNEARDQKKVAILM